ncbi:MAG: hypothetical protein VKS61_01835 [Candidatus Sericytochromatia bacterium]|nr:hypothetical protein [Candidatus Sericytochromatia bacterium]
MDPGQWIEAHGSAGLKEALAGNGLGWQLRYCDERARREHGDPFRVGAFDHRFTPAESPSPSALSYVALHGGEVATGYETVQIDPYSYIENGIGEVVLFRPPWLREVGGSEAAVFARVAELLGG